MKEKFQFMIFTLANDHLYYLNFKGDLDLFQLNKYAKLF